MICRRAALPAGAVSLLLLRPFFKKASLFLRVLPGTALPRCFSFDSRNRRARTAIISDTILFLRS